MKIRHYGILSSRTKPQLKMQQMKMGVPIVKKARPNGSSGREKLTWQQITKQLIGLMWSCAPVARPAR
jgi:hypothetical protein